MNRNQEHYEEEKEEKSQEYRPSDAYIQQEIECKKALLVEEFKQADLNKDEKLTEQELIQFLDAKVMLLQIKN